MKSWISYILLGVLIFAGFTFLTFIQASTHSLVGTDAYYHAKLAWLMGQAPVESWPLAFPWLPKTMLSADRYIDHHFLFHVLMIPFVTVSLQYGSKWAAICFGTMAFISFQAVLPKMLLRYRVLASLAFFAVSPGFIFRMTMVRAQSLSLAILFFLVVALHRGNYVAIASLCAIYVWMYSAFPLLLLLCGAFAVVECWHSKRIPWKLVLAVFLGLLIGIVVNPYFPQNLAALYHHIFDKFQPTGHSVKVGNEWYPYAFVPFLKHVAPGIFLYTIALGATIHNRDRPKTTTALLIFTALALALNLRSRRFVELFPPFAVVTFAYAARDYCLNASSMAFSQATNRTRLLGWLAAMLVCISGCVHSFHATKTQLRYQDPYWTYQAAAGWLAHNSNPGEFVVTADWDDFPRLFHFNHHNTYMVGLDPYFLFAYDQTLFKQWVEFTYGRAPKPVSDFIEQTLGSRFVFVDSKHFALRKLLESDPRIRMVFDAQDSSVYQVF